MKKQIQRIRHLRVSKEVTHNDLMVDNLNPNQADKDMFEITSETMFFKILTDEFSKNSTREKQDEIQSSQEKIIELINSNQEMQSFICNHLVETIAKSLNLKVVNKTSFLKWRNAA